LAVVSHILFLVEKKENMTFEGFLVGAFPLYGKMEMENLWSHTTLRDGEK